MKQGKIKDTTLNLIIQLNVKRKSTKYSLLYNTKIKTPVSHKNKSNKTRYS